MKIAAAAYPLDWFDSWVDYETKIAAWVSDAAGKGAELLVFPEYGAMELASLGGREVAADLEGALREVDRHKPAADAMHARLAAHHGVHILSGSGPVYDVAHAGDRPVNRASLFGPDGLIGHQDKVMMTRFEREDWHVVAGEGLKVFDTALGRIGVLICYDSEFPLLVRAMAEAGAEIVLVPSCTERVSGFHRVATGAKARALENTIVTVQSPTVGDAPWSPAVDRNSGKAAIYVPSEHGVSDDGVIAEGVLDRPMWVAGTVDLDRLRRLRTSGEMRNYADWSAQPGAVALGGRIERQSLVG